MWAHVFCAVFKGTLAVMLYKQFLYFLIRDFPIIPQNNKFITYNLSYLLAQTGYHISVSIATTKVYN